MAKEIQRYLGTKSVLTDLGQKMQEYIDDSSVESDDFLTGLDVTQTAAVELFNDFLLFLNDGIDPPGKVKTP